MLKFEAPVTPNTDTYEKEIQSEIRLIKKRNHTDYAVVKGYRDYQGRYETAIMNAYGSEEPIKEYYIKK